MPKIKHKTHKGLSKRVKVTANRKVRFKASFASHLMSGKGGNRRRRLRRSKLLTNVEAARVLAALGPKA